MNDQEKEKKQKSMDRSMTFRMIAGALLLYIVYQMISEGSIPNTQGFEKILMILGVVGFSVCGILFIYQGIKYKRDQSMSVEENPEKMEEPEANLPATEEKAEELKSGDAPPEDDTEKGKQTE